jgi:hypothetical protein
MRNLKYQNYSHYLLPITIAPLEYGKLIYQKDNIFIIQLNNTNIVVINTTDNENSVKLFRKGDLIFEYKDIKLSENHFIRTILNNKYTFKNNKLISTEILNRGKFINIIPLLILIILFLIYPDNFLISQLAVIPFKSKILN